MNKIIIENETDNITQKVQLSMNFMQTYNREIFVVYKTAYTSPRDVATYIHKRDIHETTCMTAIIISV